MTDVDRLREIRAARVLIVDDQIENVRLLQRLLSKAGYTDLEATTDPRTVLPTFVSSPPDILLLDLNMPELDGFGVMEQLTMWTDGSHGACVPVLVLTSDGSRSARERSLSIGAKDFLSKPFDSIEVQQRIENLLETRFLHLELKNRNDRLEEKVDERTADLWQTVGRLEEAKMRIRSSEEETVTKLAIAAEFRDNDTARHILRMSDYCRLLAAKAGQSEERCKLIEIASRMHDIGKIGTPDSILLKPASLTIEERSVMQEHAENGYRILAHSESEVLQLAASIALTHHERLDGTGYPRNLSDGEIPLEGRIAAIADVFDALTTDRVYRKAMSLEDALAVMSKGRGSHFDRELYDLFLAAMPEVLAIKEGLDDPDSTITFLPYVDVA